MHSLSSCLWDCGANENATISKLQPSPAAISLAILLAWATVDDNFHFEAGPSPTKPFLFGWHQSAPSPTSILTSNALNFEIDRLL